MRLTAGGTMLSTPGRPPITANDGRARPLRPVQHDRSIVIVVATRSAAWATLAARPRTPVQVARRATLSNGAVEASVVIPGPREHAPALPFAAYPSGGRVLLGKPKGDVARRGYGRDVLAWCGFQCAYCGLDMSTFEGWLQLSVDHVVPQQAIAVGFPAEWLLDAANLAACCRSCNDLFNRDPVVDPVPPSLDAFFDLRDRLYRARRLRIAEHRGEERVWFEDNVVPVATKARESASPADLFAVMLARAANDAARSFGYPPPPDAAVAAVFARIPVPVREELGRGLLDGILIPLTEEHLFTVAGLAQGKGPYRWFSQNRAPALPSANWEYFFHVAEFVRLTRLLGGRYHVGFEDGLMDVSVRDESTLLWYVEVKAAASQIQRLLAALQRFGESVDTDAPDRGIDPLRKAKYLVRHRPRYLSLVGGDVRQHYDVAYTGRSSFALLTRAESPEVELTARSARPAAWVAP